jgi:hypothetical protein
MKIAKVVDACPASNSKGNEILLQKENQPKYQKTRGH